MTVCKHKDLGSDPQDPGKVGVVVNLSPTSEEVESGEFPKFSDDPAWKTGASDLVKDFVKEIEVELGAVEYIFNPRFGKLRQAWEFQARQGYTVRPCLKSVMCIGGGGINSL